MIAYLLVVLGAYFASRQQYVLINRAGEGFLRALRVRVFDHIQRQSLAFFDRNKSGVLIARMTADVESMGELVQFGLLQLLGGHADRVLARAAVCALVAAGARGVLVLPIIVVASRKFQRDSNGAYLDVRENVGHNLSTLQEGIAGVRVIQAYAREPEQTRRFVKSNRSLFDSHVRSVKVSTWYFGLVEALRHLRHRARDRRRRMAGGPRRHHYRHVIAAVLLLAQLFEPVQQLSQLYNTCSRRRRVEQAVRHPRHGTRRGRGGHALPPDG